MHLLNTTKESITYTSITVAYADVENTEIIDSVLKILRYAKARISIDVIEIGESYYCKGYNDGISDNAWSTIRKNSVLLKCLSDSPKLKLYKDINLSLKRELDLFFSIKKYSFLDKKNKFIIIDNQQSLSSRKKEMFGGYEICNTFWKEKYEQMIKYAFNLCLNRKYHRIAAFTTKSYVDDVFIDLFTSIGKEYQSINKEIFVFNESFFSLEEKSNLFDVALVNSINDIFIDKIFDLDKKNNFYSIVHIGKCYSIFEASETMPIHMIKSDCVNLINLINASIMMLEHIGQEYIGKKIENALFSTIKNYNENELNNIMVSDFLKKVINNLTDHETKTDEYININTYPDRSKLFNINNKKDYENAIISEIEVSVYFNDNAEELLKIMRNIKSEFFKLNSAFFDQLMVYPDIFVNFKVNGIIRCFFKAELIVNEGICIDFVKILEQNNFKCVSFSVHYLNK